MDAQVSYAFHTEKKLHPEKFKNQLANQVQWCSVVCVIYLSPSLELIYIFPNKVVFLTSLRVRYTIFLLLLDLFV